MKIFFAYSAFKILGLYTCLASPLSRIRIKNKKLNKFLKAFESLSIPAAERMLGRMFLGQILPTVIPESLKLQKQIKAFSAPLAVIAIVPSN